MSIERPSGRARLGLALLLFLACFGFRAGYIVRRDLPASLAADHGPRFGHEMNRAALAVSRTGQILDVFGDDSGPSAHLSPAYPYLLGGAYRLVGPDPRRMRLAQCLLSAAFASAAIALVPVVAWRTGLRPWAGPLAVIPMLANPFDLGLECRGEWEQPLAFLTLMAVILDAEARRRESWRSTAGAVRSGLLMAWSTLLSPPVALAAGLAPLGESLADREARGRIARSLAIQAAIVLAALAPWTARNYRDLGGLVPLRSNLGLELDLGCDPEATGYFDDASLRRHPLTSAAELARYREVGELAYMKSRMRAALAWIGEHPGRYARLTARRLALFWFAPVPETIRLKDPGSTRRYYLAERLLVATNGLALLGLASLLIRRHPARWIFAGALFGPTLIYAGIQVMDRYGYPAHAVAGLLAADFVLGLVFRRRSGEDAR